MNVFDNLAKENVFDRFSKEEPKNVFDKMASEKSIFDTATSVAKNVGGVVAGAAEITANLATQIVGLPASGYAAISDLFTGRKDAEKIAQAMIYQPQTEYGKAGMDSISGLFEWWNKKSVGVGEKVEEVVTPTFGEKAGAVAGATVASTIEAAPLLLGEAYGKVKGKVKASQAKTFHEELVQQRIKLEREQAARKSADLNRAYLGEEIPKSNVAYDEQWAKVGEEVAGNIERGYVGEEIAKPKPEVTPYDEFVRGRVPSEEAQLTKQGMDVFDRIKRGYLGDEVVEGRTKADIAPLVSEYVGPKKEIKQLPQPKIETPTVESSIEFIDKLKAGELPPKQKNKPPVQSNYPENQVPDIKTTESDIAALNHERNIIKTELDEYARTGEKPRYNLDIRFLSDKMNKIEKSLSELEKRKAFLEKNGPFGSEKGSSKMVMDAAKATMEFFSPFSAMPGGKRYLELRYKAKGDAARVDRITKRLSDRLKDLPDNEKADAFNAIRGEIPIDTLPQDLQLLAKQTRADIDRVGSLLVKSGLLDKKTFDAHKGSYVHYMYLRHILPDDARIPIGSGGRMDLGYLKHRVLDDLNLPKPEIEKIRRELGLIEDLSIAAPVGVGKALGDLQKAKFFDVIANDPEFAWSPSRVTIDFDPNGKPIKMGIGKLVDEVRAYKEMIDRGAKNPEILDRYKLLNDSLENAKKALDKTPNDHIMLPNSPNYGELAGTFVRKEIANDIMPVLNMSATELEGLARVWNNAGRALESGMTLYKAGKVAGNPPTVVRNVVSNFFQTNMSGIGLQHLPSATIEGIRSVLNKDKYYRQFERQGGFKTNWSQSELREVLGRFEKIKGGRIDKFFMTVADLTKYYGKIDDITKVIIFRDAVTRRGMSVPDAAIHAHKWGMDYSLASRSVKHARRTVLPMATYYYKIAPLIAESLVTNPLVIGKYFIIPYALSKAAAYRYDWTEKELDKYLKMMAERTKNQGSYTLIPSKDNQGNIEIVNLEYFTPWGNWLQAARDVHGGRYIDAINQFGGVLGPYGKAISMVATKKAGEVPKDPFTGQPIYSRLDSPQDKMLKQIEWYWQLFGPSAFSSGGALGYTYKAAMGQKDKWGTEATGAKAFGRWMGVNVGSLDPQQITATRKAKIKELDMEIHRIYRDPQYNREERKRALMQLMIERKKIIKPE